MAVWGPRLEDALDLRVNVCEPPKFVAKLAAPGMQSTRGELFFRPVDSWGPNSVILAQGDPQKVAQLDTVGIFSEAASCKLCVFTWDQFRSMLGVRFLQSGTQITLEQGQGGEKTPVLNLDLKLQLSVPNLLEVS